MYGFKKEMLSGVIFVAFFATLATFASKIEIIKSIGFSPLVIGIVFGIIYANIFANKTQTKMQSGITFSAKKILRFAIVLYGFRLTFQDIASVGLEGFMASLIMLSSTMIIGTYFGIKIFKLNKDTSILTASGASVCGAAAVLATEPVLKAKNENVAIAVSMVVLFGTLSMFLYPILYESFIKDSSGFLHMSPSEFGIYVGSSVHEVAQVVAIPASIPNANDIMAHNAVIVKMSRVLLIAPMLVILGLILSFTTKKSTQQSKISIPWFAVYFIVVAGFNSLNLVPKDVVDTINMVDTFLLTMAMSALGMGTIFKNFKNSGALAFNLALVMFVWLVIGGFIVTKVVTSIF